MSTDNPYGNFMQMTDHRTGGAAVDEYRPGGAGSERLFTKTASGYEINASSKQDFMTRVAALQTAISRGDDISRRPNQELVQKRTAALREAFSDRKTANFQVIGEALGDTIWETLGRR